MKQSKLLVGLIGICLLLGFSSCEGEDKSVFGDDFEVPELTDANTIQFTVDVTGERKTLQVIGGGGKMAIEWGDGRLQRVTNPDRETITYKYGNQRTYQVRIWAEDLDFCSLGLDLSTVSNLRLGYLPKMKYLSINGFVNTLELNLEVSCPNIESLNIGNCADLERINFNECKRLQFAEIYAHPKLTSLQFENHPDLTCLRCSWNDELVSLSLKNMPALAQLGCYNNPRLSMIELDDEMVINELTVNECSFQSMDFLKKLPLLRILECSGNQIKELDLSNHLSLFALSCNNNKSLIRLQIPRETKTFMRASFYSCNLDGNALNAIFDALTTIPEFAPVTPSARPKCTIAYYDNPGVSSCNNDMPVNKGWDVVKEPAGTY